MLLNIQRGTSANGTRHDDSNPYESHCEFTNSSHATPLHDRYRRPSNETTSLLFQTLQPTPSNLILLDSVHCDTL